VKQRAGLLLLLQLETAVSIRVSFSFFPEQPPVEKDRN